jgi:hypothetical protein
MDVEQAPVEVRFSCRRCGWEWRENYERLRWSDYEGDVFESYFRHGVPVPSPALGRRCASCGSLNIDWTDAAFLPHPAAAEHPAHPVVHSRWAAPSTPTLSWFRRAAHQRQPMTRRFP